MSQLLAFKDREQVKVITGVRRCGKSTLLELFKRHLRESGVPDERIIHMNLESMEHMALRDSAALWKHIKARVSKRDKTYILLDEIQRVLEWEDCVNSLRIDCDSDIYITGSNASLLATHRSSVLGGRCAGIRMLPLSFKEYLDFNPIEDTDDLAIRLFRQGQRFEEYQRFGGMPPVAGAGMPEAAVNTTLLDIFDAIISRDVIERNNVRDPALLRAVAKYLVDNIGSAVSPKKISDYLTSSGRKTTSETIDNYLNMLEDAFLFYGVERYDLKGKLHLKTLGRYYVVDTGIRNALLGHKETDYGHVLENIVYFELLRRYDRVSIGKQNGYEVDFVADSSGDRKYYQVAATVMDTTTLQRELRPLEAIRDNYEKTILTMDSRNTITTQKGIKVINIIDFLLLP